jgi:hypothetical protein
MAKEERHNATYAVKWAINDASGKEPGEQAVAIEFTNIKGEAVRVLLHPKEAVRFSQALDQHLAKQKN